MALVSVAKAGEIPSGEGRVVDVAGKTLALFNVGGTYYAIDNACPHRGGPLGDGDVDGALVACPWHGWRWDVTSGGNANNPAVRVACFPVTVEDDRILVDLP
jgi:nitrite reductase (NADH) small subunit/3-phenylpropionate/trans-cinnamate dioxygenase ferredoxin subunit